MTEPISEPDLRTDTEREADSNAEEARQNLEPEVPDPKLSDEERTIPKLMLPRFPNDNRRSGYCHSKVSDRN